MDAGPYDDPRLTAVGLFVEVYAGLTSRLDVAHAAKGLSGNDFDVLIRLARSPGRRLRMTDLSSQTMLSTSGVTRVVDRLERLGCVCRRPDPGDRRSLLAELTDAGGELLDAHIPELVKVVDDAYTSVLSPKQLDNLIDALRTLRAALHPHADADTRQDATQT
ncbi:MAG: MarR family winged helix-turn-helix transcriptional regulator [Stackebrandtia sp.]